MNEYIIDALLLGITLALDAFSVSMVYGAKYQKLNLGYSLIIVLTFGILQTLMPFISWSLIHYLSEKILIISKISPYISLILLTYIGIKMIINKDDEDKVNDINYSAVLMAGIATSIDALSVGFTFSNYNFNVVIVEVIIIGLITSIICLIGVYLGKRGGYLLGKKVPTIGGIVLILVGIKIFISGVF